MVRYRYEKLRDGEIRLLTLQRGKPGDPLTIAISHVQLSQSKPREKPTLRNIQDHLPTGWEVHQDISKKLYFRHQNANGRWEQQWEHPDPGFDGYPDEWSHNSTAYEALSYTWGSLTDLAGEIAISSDDSSDFYPTGQTLPIGSNLASALCHLRFENRSRRLWVDALCIDQQNINERSEQVQRAGLVYQEAKQVLIWLGHSDNDSDMAMRALDRLGQQFVLTADGRDYRAPGAEETEWNRPQVPLPYDRSTWAAIDSLLRRSWFGRVWIVQEILLSGAAVFVCGTEEVRRERFGRALFSLRYKEQLGEPLSRGLLTTRVALVVGTISTWTISSAVRVMHEGSCTDDKDAIYGALGLFPASFQPRITTDYTLNTETVYTNFVKSHIEHVKRLELLHMCELREEQRLRLPSWVPNFSMTPSLPIDLPYWHFCAGYSACHVTFCGDHLQVTGVRAATVLAVSDVVPNYDDGAEKGFADTVGAVRRLRDDMEQDSPCRCQEGEPEPFIWTIMGNFLRHRLPESPLYKPWEELKADMKNSAIFGSGSPATAVKSSLSHAEDFGLRMLMGRRVMKTTMGSLGVTPAATQEGDLVACFLGCEAPVVLRPNGDEAFRVVGQCFLTDVADLKAFLGPLPYPWIVKFFPESIEGSGVYRYLDTETGELSDQDPRLGSLSVDIEVKPRSQIIRTRDDPRLFQVFRSRRTGDEQKSDPRLSPDVLRGRGVDLQRFTLI